MFQHWWPITTLMFSTRGIVCLRSSFLTIYLSKRRKRTPSSLRRNSMPSSSTCWVPMRQIFCALCQFSSKGPWERKLAMPPYQSMYSLAKAVSAHMEYWSYWCNLMRKPYNWIGRSTALRESWAKNCHGNSLVVAQKRDMFELSVHVVFQQKVDVGKGTHLMWESVNYKYLVQIVRSVQSLGAYIDCKNG